MESADLGGEGQATARRRQDPALWSRHEHLGETKARHIPVLVAEVVAGLGVRPGGCYLDATVGGGGHTAAILDASAPDGWVLGLDRDAEAVLRARERLSAYGDRVVVEHASYVDLLDVLRQVQRGPLDGVIFDLGFSSWQIEDPARGFSFLQDGPLDMRFDTGHGATAADLVNQLSEDALAQILFDYGGEARSRRIARAIVAARPIGTTGELARIVSAAVGGRRGARGTGASTPGDSHLSGVADCGQPGITGDRGGHAGCARGVENRRAAWRHRVSFIGGSYCQAVYATRVTGLYLSSRVSGVPVRSQAQPAHSDTQTDCAV